MNLHEQITQAGQGMSKQSTVNCNWEVDEQNVWHSACGYELWLHADDGPEENEMRYCPFCGKVLKEHISKANA